MPHAWLVLLEHYWSGDVIEGFVDGVCVGQNQGAFSCFGAYLTPSVDRTNNYMTNRDRNWNYHVGIEVTRVGKK